MTIFLCIALFSLILNGDGQSNAVPFLDIEIFKMVPNFPHFGSASMLPVLATICNSVSKVETKSSKIIGSRIYKGTNLNN